MTAESSFRDLLLQHARRSRFRGDLDAPDVTVSVENPFCGDRVSLRLRAEHGRLLAVRFTGHGCSLSQASASIMAQQTEGGSIEDALRLKGRFGQFLQGEVDDSAALELGDLRAFAGVGRFPARLRCVLLAWDALELAASELNDRPTHV